MLVLFQDGKHHSSKSSSKDHGSSKRSASKEPLKGDKDKDKDKKVHTATQSTHNCTRV